jgi:hypothetical protein
MMNKRLVARHRHLFLDGYNVIHALERYKALSETSLEAARDCLIDDLIDYCAYMGEDVTVVFDAYTNKGRVTKKATFKGIHVVFTREHQTADSYIEVEAERLGTDPRNLVRVVTSDWAEQQAVLGSGAIRLTPREFYFDLQRVHDAIQNRLPVSTGSGSSIEDKLTSEDRRVLEAWRRGKR